LLVKSRSPQCTIRSPSIVRQAPRPRTLSTSFQLPLALQAAIRSSATFSGLKVSMYSALPSPFMRGQWCIR
jgi:hypothetical protein